MKTIVPVLCLLLIIGCGGDDNPTNAGQPIANQTISLPSGSFVDFRFTVDTDVQQNVVIQGSFSVDGGQVQMAIMNESEFQTWQEGGTPGVLYSPGQSSGETFRIAIDDSDIYYVVFSNSGSSAVTVTSEIFLLSTTDEGEL